MGCRLRADSSAAALRDVAPLSAAYAFGAEAPETPIFESRSALREELMEAAMMHKKKAHEQQAAELLGGAVAGAAIGGLAARHVGASTAGSAFWGAVGGAVPFLFGKHKHAKAAAALRGASRACLERDGTLLLLDGKKKHMFGAWLWKTVLGTAIALLLLHAYENHKRMQARAKAQQMYAPPHMRMPAFLDRSTSASF